MASCPCPKTGLVQEEATTTSEAVWVAKYWRRWRPETATETYTGSAEQPWTLGWLLKASPEQLAAVGLLERQRVALLTPCSGYPARRLVAGGGPAGARLLRAPARILRAEMVVAGVAVTRTLLLGDRLAFT